MTKTITTGIFAIILGLSVFVTNSAHAAPASLSILYGPNMQVGSRGTGVVELQAFLSELGYLNVPANVPLGYFGPLTSEALRTYQTNHNVPPTGNFGPLTKSAIQQQMQSRCWLGACL